MYVLEQRLNDNTLLVIIPNSLYYYFNLNNSGSKFILGSVLLVYHQITRSIIEIMPFGGINVEEILFPGIDIIKNEKEIKKKCYEDIRIVSGFSSSFYFYERQNYLVTLFLVNYVFSKLHRLEKKNEEKWWTTKRENRNIFGEIKINGNGSILIHYLPHAYKICLKHYHFFYVSMF